MSGFGLPSTTPSTGGFPFGAPSLLQTATAAANPQQTGFGFGGVKPAASEAPAFGTGTMAQPVAAAGGVGFTFGTPAITTAPAAASTSFAFGTTTAAPTAAVAPTTGSSFSFGNLAATTSTPAAGGTAAPTFSFGNPNTNAPAVTSSAAPALSFGAAPASNNAAPTGGNTFSFAKPATTTSASLNFGTTTTAATSFTGFNSTTGGGGIVGIGGGTGGMFGPKPTFNTLNTALPAISTAAAPAPFVGLGGLDVTSSQPKPGESKQDNVKVKETQVPEEIAKTVEVLKTHIKNQKSMSSDIGRASTSKLSNVSSEILSLQWSLQEISNTVEANYNQIKLLRKETSRVMQSVEMAQRTQDTPAGLQFENSAPFQFFQNLVHKYETDLINFRHQIALTEKHMRSLTTPQAVSPDDLKRGFKQINESFVSLAGRLNELHQKVEVHKEQFLNLRKYRLRDSANVFAKLDSVEPNLNTSKITSGPTPFSNIGGIGTLGKSMSSMGSSAPGQTGNS